jgi:ABC-type amino acid transport substrate-binding protein
MANTVLHKRSTTASAVPSAGSLTTGELAINTADGTIFTKKTDNSVINIVTSNKLSAFAATSSSELANVISDETGSGLLVFGTSPNFLTSVTTSSTSFNVFNATATTINAFGAATTLTIGATSGTANIRNATLNVGNTNATVKANNGTLSLSGGSSFGAPGGSVPLLTLDYTGNGDGFVSITGGNLYLGTRVTEELDLNPVEIVFEGLTDNGFETTLTPVDPTADRFIYIPDATGTIALTANKLNAFAATTSSELAGVISDETGTGVLVFGTSPSFTTSVDTSSSSFNVFNANATTINAFGAATGLTVGATTGTTTIRNTTVTLSNATTINLGTSAASLTTVTIGSSSTGGNLILNAQGDLRWADSDSSNWVAFQAPTTVANDNTYTLPSAVGSSNQVLRIASVSGNDATLEWATVSGGGGTPTGFEQIFLLMGA